MKQIKGSILSFILEETKEGPSPPDGSRNGEEGASQLFLEGYVRVSHVGRIGKTIRQYQGQWHQDEFRQL